MFNHRSITLSKLLGVPRRKLRGARDEQRIKTLFLELKLISFQMGKAIKHPVQEMKKEHYQEILMKKEHNIYTPSKSEGK